MKNWEDNIRKVIPYVPGEQPKEKDIIKLNTNENPYPPSPKVMAGLEEIKREDFRLYPDSGAENLVSALADAYHVKKEQVFVGVGSDDVLAMCFMTFFNSDKPILFPDITYSFYDVWAGLFKIPFKTCPLREDFTINPQDYMVENGGIIFPNPNAPTGIYESLSMVENIVRHNESSIVIIDEAYIDFGGESALGLVNKYDNLLVIQTFSKSRSLAGLRIGYAIGSTRLIKYLNDVKYSFNSYTMNVPSIICARAALEDIAYFHETRNQIIAVRENVKKELRKMGFDFPDSKANFIFARHRKVSGKELFEKLRERKIYVRYFDKPRIDNYLRIAIGTKEDMDMLLQALGELTMEE